ncbi:MAG: M56 family metallopeptidase [Verrucomicrobiota bacterium]
MSLDLQWWGRLTGLLATEATLVVAMAWLAARWLRSPQMKRAVWQAALLGVALLWVAELAGARGQLARWLPAECPRRTLSVRVLDAPHTEPVTEPFLFEPTEAPLPTVTPPRSVWWPGWLWLAGLTLLTGRLALSRAWLMGCVWRSHGRDHRVGRRISVLECARLAAAFVRRTCARTSTSPVHSQKAEAPRCDASALQDADAGSPAPDDTGAMVARLRRPLGLRRVRLLVWPRLRGPVAFGVLRPTVALPEDFRTRFSPAQCEAMLAHELAHLAARDPLWLTMADLVCALAWWHPAVWWARRQLRSACESAADEAAALVPDGRAALAESLVTFGRELASPRWVRGIGVAGDGLKSQLARRVKVLLHASGGWCAVRPARMWATRFGATGVVAALVLAPWPGVNGAGLAPLLAAVKAVETVSPRATNTTETLPYVREHVEPGHPEIRVTDYLVPVHDSGNQSVKFPLLDPSRSDATNVLGLFDHMDLELKGGPRTVGILEARQRASASSPVLPASMETLLVEPKNSVYVQLRRSDEAAAQTLIQAGLRLMEARQFDSAEARFRAALSLAPSNAEAAWRLQDLARAPTNIELEVQFAEITERGSDDLGLDWLFGQSPTNNPALQNGPATNLLTEPGSPSDQNLRVDLLRTEGQSATLTEAQFAALRKRLEGRGGVEFVAAPKLITQSGRQARIAVSDMRNIVSGVDTTQGSATNQAGIGYQTEQIATGPTVDLVGTIEGGTTRLAIVAKVTEFLGYDPPKPGQEVKAASPGGKPVKGVMPLPHLRVRSTQADVSAGAGETVVLRGPLASDTQLWKDKVVGLGDLPLLGRLFRSAGTNVVRKRLYVFVTPSRISATGEKQ